MATILITGANRGIGLAITTLALTRGDKVIAGCRNPASAAQLSVLQKNYFERCSIIELDVVDEQSLERAASSLSESLDLLVCNAGVGSGYGGMLGEENTMAVFKKVLLTNTASPFFTTRAFLPHLRKSSGLAKVAVISSLMGSQAHTAANAYAYRASKAGANNIAVTLSRELSSENIAVATYHPGWVRTDMGGPNGLIDTKTSVTGLVSVIEGLDLPSSGSFFSYDGSVIPW
mgnify:CR=1 FL=1